MDVSRDELQTDASVITKDLLQTIIRRQENSENIFVKSFIVSPGCEKGASFASVVLSVKVLLQIDVEEITENLIFKIPHSKGVYHDWIVKWGDFFANESGVYMNVIPAMVKLQEEKGLEPIGPSCPQHYYSRVDGSNGFMVLRDLRPEGYMLPDKMKGLNEAHCRLVMKELAKFHALALGLKYGNPENKKQFDGILQECFMVGFFQDIFQSAYKTSLNLVKTLTKEKRIYDAAQVMEGWNILDVLKTKLKPVEPYAVICHGDIWCSNTLFKYEKVHGTEIPVDVKLLDLQMSRYALPTTDLAYFFYTSTTRTMRKENLKQLLALYHFHFTDCLKLLNVNVPEFSLTVLEEQFRESAMFGIIMVCCLGIAMWSRAEDPVDYSQDEKEVEEQTARLAKQLLSNREDRYLIKERLVGAIEEAVEMGLL